MKLVKKNNQKIILKTILFWLGTGMIVLVGMISFRPKEFKVVNKIKKDNQSSSARADNSLSNDWQSSLASVTGSRKIDTANQNGSPKDPIDNLTSFLGKSLSEKIISSRVDLGTVKKGEEQEFASQFLEKNFDVANFEAAKLPVNLELPVINDNEIIILKDNSSKSLLKYNFEVNSLLIVNFPRAPLIKDQKINDGLLSTEEIINYAILNKDFTQIDYMISYYEKILSGLKKIAVPSSAINLHKKRIAFFGLTINIFKAIRSFPDDPVLTIAALNKYKESKSMIADIVKEVAKLK